MISNSKAPSLSSWIGRHEVAKDKLEEVKPDIKKQLRFYDQEHYHGVYTSYDQVTINYIATIVDIFRDSTYFKNPDFKFSGYPDLAVLLNLMFPKFLRKIRYKTQTKKILLESLNVGFAYRLCGYNFEGLPENDAIYKDEVFGIYVPWDMVTFDPDAEGQWDANYMFLTQYIPLNDLKKNEKLRIPKDVPVAYIPKDADNMSRSQISDQSRVEVVHIFDRGEGRHRMMIPGVDRWVYTGEWPLGRCNLFPINMLRMNDDKLYCTGPTKKLIPLNEEMEKMESMRVTHAKRGNRKYQVDEDISPESEAALKAGYDLAIVKTPQDIDIKPIEHLAIAPETYGSAESMFFFMKLLARVGEYSSGMTPKGETTATEASYVAQGSSLGITNVQDNLKDFAERDAEIFLALMRENYDINRTVWDDNLKKPVVYNKSNLKGYLEVEVDVDAAAPPDSQRRQMEALKIMELFRDDPLVNQLLIRKNALEPFELVRNVEEWMNTPAAIQITGQILASQNELPAINAASGQGRIELASKYGALNG